MDKDNGTKNMSEKMLIDLFPLQRKYCSTYFLIHFYHFPKYEFLQFHIWILDLENFPNILQDDDLTEKKIHRKTTSKEVDLTGRQPQRRTTSLDDDFKLRQPQRRTTLQKDDLTGRRP